MTRVLLLSLALACGSGDPFHRSESLTSAKGVTMTAADAVAGIGKPCDLALVPTDCLAGLTCTDLVTTASTCALEWTSLAPCPLGFDALTTATTNLGDTVDLGNLFVTGNWCVPQCDTFADCGNAQCCVSGGGFGGALHGWCDTFNPAQQYLAPLSCPGP